MSYTLKKQNNIGCRGGTLILDVMLNVFVDVMLDVMLDLTLDFMSNITINVNFSDQVDFLLNSVKPKFLILNFES